MGGALGVALLGSVVSSIYASHIDNAARVYHVTGASLAEARSSLGGGLKVAGTLGKQAAGFTGAVKDGFVNGLSSGLRLASIVVVIAGFVVWRYLPARATDHLADPVADVTDLELLSHSVVAGE
jgi:hypothetical protein